DLNKALELNPDSAEAYNYRGGAYLNLQQYKNAIADFNKALELNPDNAEAYLGRSGYYYQMGKRENAIADMEKAIQLFCQQGSSDACQKAQEVLRLMQTESQGKLTEILHFFAITAGEGIPRLIDKVH
ncbi:tetratricopeptide repeat protein, partial [Candidatus Gracilibacteria bacterium]|nr:tetratricopeptide repeat protein [Candidatus Gracilibacteria bacterium]